MDVFGGRSVVALGNHELLPALDELDAEIIRLQGIRLQVVARVEESGYAQEVGARDTAELLAFRHRRDRSEAWRDVRLARALPKYAAVDAALTAGIESDGMVLPMQTAQAAAIVAELERVRSRVPVEDLDIAEAQLVSLAAHLAPKELRSAAKQLCDLLDADGPEPAEQKAYARESLTLAAAENGVKFRGYLANENAELLRAVVHAGARPHKTVDGEHDPRSRDKRQADALTTALTIAANAWDTNTATPGQVPGHGAKANITVTIDLDDLKSATATAAATATAHATGQTVYGDALSAAVIRRLACDANVIPMVLGSNSEPLDVGRRERLVTKAMRHALNARDRGCVVCAAPPVMCDAHHLIPWLDGGVTALTNLALLCRRHHVDLHAGRWTITITNGQAHLTRPTWATRSPAVPAQPAGPDPTRPAGVRAARPPGAARTQAGDADPARSAGVRAAGCDSAVGNCTTPFDSRGSTGGPWGDADLAAPRAGRWKADGATLSAAARFAVWGERSGTESDTGPPCFATI
ncbi:DUF222 domain-containing protein [Kribbella sp. NPDC054772]